MKKVYLQRLLKIIALIVPIVLIVLFLQQYVFVFRDANTERIQKFYCEEEGSLDVAIIGASEVTAGYSPGHAYGKFGYTSYMYAMDGNVGSLYVAQLKEILSYQNPELILVEVYGFTHPKSAFEDEAKLRYFVENVPNSSNKFDTILQYNYDNKISCLFPFMKYHGNFSIVKSQLKYLYLNHSSMDSPSLLKGMTSQTIMYSGPGDAGIADGTNNHLDNASKAYLVDFLEYCQQENLDHVVFVNFPRYFQHEDKSDLLGRVADIQQIVEEYGFDFVDLQKEKTLIGLDVQTDFYNSHHLNVYGQEKLTNYLGDLIVNKYQLFPREQSAVNKAYWEASAQASEQYFAYGRAEISAGNLVYLSNDTDIPSLNN